MAKTNHAELFEMIINKGAFKQEVYGATFQAMQIIKKAIKELNDEYQKIPENKTKGIGIRYQEKSDFQVDLKFAGDVLLFLMHTNVFEFSREHQVMRTHYINEDKSRAYCGIIHIYNFLADSFKYNRMNDSGFLIARLFINKKGHFFMEGKKELSLFQNQFSSHTFGQEDARILLTSAIKYSTEFDLQTPPYAAMQEITVDDIQTTSDNMKIKTAKRMGFRFHSDNDPIV